MATKVEALVFENRAGQKLFGTLHEPAEKIEEYPTIILLSPGIKMRVGPHRLYNRITEALNSLGFTVFKFDFFGLGDSEGELDRDLLIEVYNDTESGVFVDDATDAMDWLSAKTGDRTFILGGLCGGAITSIMLAGDDSRVLGVICLGLTVTMSVPPELRIHHASKGELSALRGAYFRKLLDWKSWIRILTFRSDFSAITKSVGQAIKSNARNNSSSSADSKPPDPQSNANPRFPPAFFSIVKSGRKVLMVFSQADKAYWNYEEKFAEIYSKELEIVKQYYEVQLIQNANHVFSFREWENEMLLYVRQWLTTNFGSPH